jgi:hypothetical protein
VAAAATAATGSDGKPGTQDAWATLPWRDRHLIANRPREAVVPGYELMLQRYYAELARPAR